MSTVRETSPSPEPQKDAPPVPPTPPADRVLIFDTTLRDGEQSPGATMDRGEKLQIARALARLRVDIIEAGFPIASTGDHDAVKAIAEEIEGPVIAGLARCLEPDILAAASAVRNARRPRIHVFLATGKIHREFKLRKAPAEILRLSVEGVKMALAHCPDIEFSPEDASRTEPEFLCEVVEAVIAAGAKTVNIPDTVGYAVPEQYGALIATLYRKVPNIRQAVISVHCHNDLGLAVANSLAAVKAGARQVECTINGLGERAGNAALEEIVMALRTRADAFGVTTGVDTVRLCPTSRLVAHITGLHVQRNKAIVGENAFAHESGVHQDGMLKHRGTYEIMLPADVGAEQTRLVMGKHSGRKGLAERLHELGYDLTGEQLDAAFERFKELCDKKKSIYDADLEAIAEDRLAATAPVWEIVVLQVASGNQTLPTATVCLRKEGKLHRDAALGDGPVDALVKAIDRITKTPGQILDFHVRAVTESASAQGEVDVKVRFGDLVVSGRGVSTDIVEASARAYLNAVCRATARAHSGEPRPVPQRDER